MDQINELEALLNAHFMIINNAIAIKNQPPANAGDRALPAFAAPTSPGQQPSTFKKAVKVLHHTAHVLHEGAQSAAQGALRRVRSHPYDASPASPESPTSSFGAAMTSKKTSNKK
jgi:hypothetical protein